MSETPLPCKQCGSPVHVFEWTHYDEPGTGLYEAQCENEKCELPEIIVECSEEEAVAAWNAQNTNPRPDAEG